ncbi:hypothetical protein G6F51_007866 [Rhizopus arrhizus]|uniref:Cellulase n=1 Tax=Rhizopus oryzae TaxID=64495 RepID=A0A9P7C8Z5_RHIOR|nr:hypothetical protein G6F51_007866 [Rhizopus arrhizus]
MKVSAIAASLFLVVMTNSDVVSAGYTGIKGGATGTSQATRYWDCCKPSCGWNGKAKVSAPVRTCAKNGVTLVGTNVQSGCANGGAYTCNNNQPWVVNNNLSYGFAAARIPGGGEDRWCCSCFELTFTSTPAKGKKMVVQVTNTGYDAGTEKGTHFDLLMPGGGVGLFNGCQSQWNTPTDGWGARYGGVWNKQMCSKLPAQLRKGCEWRFGWFQGADNPTLTYREVTCPKEIVACIYSRKKKRKLAGVKGQRAGDMVIEMPTIKYVDVEESTAIENNKPVAKGTTTGPLDIMNMDGSLMGSYLLPPCSPELNPIEQFYAIIKGKLKHRRLKTYRVEVLMLAIKFFMVSLAKSSTVVIKHPYSFELYVEDNSDDDFQPVVTARKRKSREIIPQSGLQKSLKGKRKARDSEVTTTSSIGISTADEPTVFNKITLEDNDLEYSSDDFDAPVTKDPFWPSKPVPTAFKSAATSVKSSFCPMSVDKASDIKEGPKKISKRVMTIKTTVKLAIFKKEMPEAGLLDDRSRTQLNDFLSSYPEDYTFQKNSIYYDVMTSPKNHFKAFFRLAELSEAEYTKQFAYFLLHSAFIPCKFETWGAVVDLNKKAFKHQGFQKTLQLQGTLETDGVGVSIIKQNTDAIRKSPKPNIEKKVDGNLTEHIEGLDQSDLKSTEGKCVLIDPGRQDMMYCMKETSIVEEKQTLIFTKNNRSKCSRHFRYLRKRTQPFAVQKAESILSRSESNSVNLRKFVQNETT